MSSRTRTDILIPTNSRPGVLRRLLTSIEQFDLQSFARVIVANSTPASAASKIHEEYADIAQDFDVALHNIDENAGPGQARYILTGLSEAPLLMFLDDDHVITRSSLRLFDHIERDDVEIVSGLWLETESLAVLSSKGARPRVADPEKVIAERRIPLRQRPAGQLYAEGAHGGNLALVVVQVPLKRSPDLALRVDGCMPTILVKRGVFDRVAFDPGYGFYFEWLDFFMQCRREGIRPLVDTSALFWHLPSFYAAETARTISPRDRDEAFFIEKWGIVPVFIGERRVHLGPQSNTVVKFLRKVAYRVLQREG